ncbi:MAG: pilus assembly PilX N-terminal domain-containing protein [Nitrospira sp.]
MSMLAKETGAADRSSKPMGIGQDGVALLTVMMIMLILTVLGIAAITTTGLENRMAGFARTGEEAATAADSCLGVGANLIRQALIPQNSLGIPAPFLSNAVPPGPVPLINAVILHDEIYGRDAAGISTKNGSDTAAGTPNLVLAVNGLTVNGDIDYLYNENTSGTAGAITNTYRITCVASNVASGTTSSVTAVFACTLVAGSTECSKKF